MQRDSDEGMWYLQENISSVVWLESRMSGNSSEIT